MREHLIQQLAAEFQLSEPVVQRVATRIAEQCALISNRFDQRPDTGPVPTLGAAIGAAIILEFGDPKSP